ncbi:zinc finger CCCH domain-containing protein 15-like [Mizuhopecten yessoensis]|uniref:Zinc finger CCCH domain-containing protein 15 n=1 Tax=Mizuhopecten yessoensis TaxID=6573 RepID=A0A210R6F9_MIZYE|nr:zinc finger CCCH domain-containing protein 15-like [Mizuhopecten yessoensis]OWF56504.1 Zinc finger CCCH domain-containing protein 15 [Mizuhopecten yessoensis]
MPPKPKKPDGPSKKNVEKKKEKVIEDKTFGLKNKKGTKQQKFIKTVTHQIKQSNVKTPKGADPLFDNKKKKDEKAKEKELLNSLFRPVQTISKGADPKSVLCAFFKQGQCAKGAKCKFSHDLALDRKGEKRNLYEDSRDEDTMDTWDETKLEEVVAKKHGDADISKNKTGIICKHFLDAVENYKYGWFWECPSGGKTCHYRHCLPPGFLLKRDKKKLEDNEEKISMEELIERERSALGHNTTRVTLETFLAWKERKRKERIEADKKTMDKKKSDFKSGKTGGISGREMFEFNPDFVAMDDDEAQEGTFERETDPDDVDQGKVVELNLESLAGLAQSVDGTGTVSTSSHRTGTTSGAGDSAKKAATKLGENEEDKLDLAGALPPKNHISETDEAIAAAMAATVNGDAIEIDEDLFDGEDLDLVEEDLDTLDLSD